MYILVNTCKLLVKLNLLTNLPAEADLEEASRNSDLQTILILAPQQH